MSLQVDELMVYYRTLRGDVRALDGVTFEIADGEIMGLAGESGCGKSTLGKSLIRLDGRMRHVGGSVTLDGRELPLENDRGMNEFRFKQVSIVPQYAMSALNPTRKVGKIAEELLESRGVDFDEVQPELVRRLELVGLSANVLGMFPIELSGGMKQRAVMVLSTLLNPSLLIADEVTSALDVSSQRAVAEMLVEFRERSFVKSIVVITHDLAVLYQIADTILVMYAGQLAEKAAADVVISRPGIPTRSFCSRRCPRSACATRTGASRASPGGRRPSSTRRPGADSATAARSRSRSATSSRRSSRSSRATVSPAGR